MAVRPAPASGIFGTLMKEILIVDRCPQTKLVLTPFLEEQGYVLTFVPDSAAAMEALWSKSFAVVLVDTTDPGVGGEGLLEAVASGASPGGTVIPFVDRDDAERRARLQSRGFKVLFPKPLDFHIMTNVLADVTE